MAAPSQRQVAVADARPDPSAHGSSAPRLQDSASKAALLATQSETNRSSSASPQNNNNVNPLGPDGKLSSASAATSLKHAKPHELPSFPTVGIDTQSSGGKAASVATTNQKPFEHWKPELSSSASKAALMASKDGGKLNLWQPTASEEGMTAAGTALGKQNALSPQLDYGYTAQGTSNALKAAAMSVSSGHKRSISNDPAPLPQYPDAANSTLNALNAASVAHTPSTRKKQPLGDSDRIGSAAMEAARVQNLQASPAMYGEHPPVNIEVEERRHQDALRASAISFAKQMYDVQQQKSDASAASAAAAARQSDRSMDNDELRQQAVNYINLQEEAQRLANERLAKLDPDGVFAYRQHYGYGEEPKRNRLSVKGSRKGRASTEEADSSEDEQRAGRVRRQQNRLQADIASVDDKRTKDRADLMATAQKLVQQRMSTMDEKVFQETGKASPAMMEEWEAKAKAKAAAESETRMANHGKVHIGGGKYMDQSEIDAIAAGRMQPTLDEISDTAQKQRIRDEEVRLDQERRKAEEEREKQRDRETKAELQRQKNEEKQKANEEKARAKAEKDAEKNKAKAEKDAEKQAEKQRKAEEKEQKQKAKMEAKQTEEERKRQKKSESDADALAVKQREAAEKAEADAEKERVKAEAEARVEQDAVLKDADEKAAKDAGGAALVGAGAGAGAAEVAGTSAAPAVADTSVPEPATTEHETIDRTNPEPAKAEPIVADPAPLKGSRIEPGDPLVDPDAEPVKETEREIAAHPEVKPVEDETPPVVVAAAATPGPVPETKVTEPEPTPAVDLNKPSIEDNLSVGRPSVEKSDRNRLHKSKPSASSGEHVADRALPLEREWQANRLSLEQDKKGPGAATTAGTATGTEYTDVFKNDPTGPASTPAADKSTGAKEQPPKKRGFFNKLVKRTQKSSESSSKTSSATTQPAPVVSEASKGVTPTAERADTSTEEMRGRTSEVSNDYFQEARDNLENESEDATKLAAPPVRSSLISARDEGSPARSTSKFQEEL